MIIPNEYDATYRPGSLAVPNPWRRYGLAVHLLATIFLMTVALGGGFGEAAASATVNNDGTIDVQLQVEAPADTVVAHVIDPGGQQETVSLARRADGSFGGMVSTPRSNRVVVFEALVGDDSITSRPVTFLDLGVAPSLLGIDEGPNLLVGEPTSDAVILGFDESESIWIAVALLAVALALVAWWAAGPGSRGARVPPAKTGVGDESPDG